MPTLDVATLYVLVSAAIVSPFISQKLGKKNAVKELEQLYVTTIQEQKAKIRQLYGQLTRMQQVEAESEEDNNEDIVKILEPLAKQYGIPPEVLNDPAISKTLKKYKHLIPLVAKFLSARNSTHEMV